MTEASSIDDSAIWGLGYRGNENGAASLANHYLQQCLNFHLSEESKRRKDEREQHNTISASPDYVHSVETSTWAGIDDAKQPCRTQIQIDAARQRAKAILEKFQQQQEYLLQHRNNTSGFTNVEIGKVSAERKRALDSEEKRKDDFWKRNCECAIERERTRVNQQLRQLQQDSDQHLTLQRTIENQQRLRYEQRKLSLQQNAAQGIGTKQRGRLENKRQRILETDPAEQPSTLALYLSGLPTDESVDSSFIENLFSSFGTIRKIHFYRDKETRKLKGDGLVVYSRPKHCDGDNFLRNICSQMNGAELPGGEILAVEPADSNTSSSQYLPTPGASHQGLPREVEVTDAASRDLQFSSGVTSEGGDDEDLDDFFSSL